MISSTTVPCNAVGTNGALCGMCEFSVIGLEHNTVKMSIGHQPRYQYQFGIDTARLLLSVLLIVESREYISFCTSS